MREPQAFLVDSWPPTPHTLLPSQVLRAGHGGRAAVLPGLEEPSRDGDHVRQDVGGARAEHRGRRAGTAPRTVKSADAPPLRPGSPGVREARAGPRRAQDVRGESPSSQCLRACLDRRAALRRSAPASRILAARTSSSADPPGNPALTLWRRALRRRTSPRTWTRRGCTFSGRTGGSGRSGSAPATGRTDAAGGFRPRPMDLRRRCLRRGTLSFS